jgi:hypothetical protein
MAPPLSWLEITCVIMMTAGTIGLHYLLIQELIRSIRRTRAMNSSTRDDDLEMNKKDISR